MSILEMAEHFNVPLYPVQKFVLKLLYRIPLDAKKEQIVVRSPLEAKPTLLLTEVDYLAYLKDQGRCHLPETPSYIFTLAGGRRGGKSHLCRVVAAFESLANTYQGDNNIWTFHTDKDQSQLSLQHYTNIFRKAPSLKVVSSGGLVTTTKASSKGQVFFRGHSGNKRFGGIDARVLIFDDAAYLDNFKTLFEDTAASLITHNDRLAFVASSPSKGGFFRELCLSGDPMVQIPSWEMNPAISEDYLRDFRKRFPENFKKDFQAQV